jgi:ABC-type nitrate/sulfonate/bicarbonate transport system substrate-binding protein
MFRRKALAAFATAVALSLAAACGGAASDSGGASGGSGGPDTVRLGGVVKANAGNWFYSVAIRKGIFDKYGIKLERVLAPTSAAAITALVAGDVDLTGPTFDAGIQAQANAPMIKWVGMGYSKFPYDLVVQPGINSVDDLKGKVCGGGVVKSADGMGAQVLIAAASNGTMKLDQDYQMISLGASDLASQSAAMASKQIQCLAQIPPTPNVLAAQGFKVLVKAQDVGSYGWPLYGLISSPKFYDARPDVSARFFAAVMESIVWLYDPANKQEAIDILSQEAGIKPEIAAFSYDLVTLGGFAPDLKLTSADLLAVKDGLGKQGVTLAGVSQANVDSLIEPKVAKAAFDKLSPDMQAKVTKLAAEKLAGKPA